MDGYVTKSTISPENMLSLYQSGLSLAKIGEQAGVSKQAVQLTLANLPGYQPRTVQSPTLTTPDDDLTTWQRWRKRKLLGEEPPKCKHCGIVLKGGPKSKSKERGICTVCWQEKGGKAAKAENAQRQREFMTKKRLDSK